MMRSIVLVHGAGSGPWVFDGWDVPGAVAVDLHEGLGISTASMEDYAACITRAVSAAARPVGVVAWSMGGLAAMMAAGSAPPDALVVIEPSAPEEVRGRHPGVPLRSGTFDPEDAYGRFPEGMAARPESRRARSERKRGIAVPAVACPFLVVSGADYAQERGRAVAARYGADHLAFPDLGHFDLVRDGKVRRAITRWLEAREPPANGPR